MIAEQREAFDEMITKMRRGRLTRRTFLARALGMGFTATTSLSLLEACGGSHSRVIPIVWQSENDTSGAYAQIVDNFNKTSEDVYVVWRNGTGVTGDMPTIERSLLQARHTSIDMLSIDIVNVAEFAANGWLAPVTERQWPLSERTNYLPGPLKGCTFEGTLWAAPFRTDVGLLYYRKDIIGTPPASWEELTAQAIQHRSKATYGYLWQGAQYEGLVCNFCEVLDGYGGAVFDANDPKKVTVQSPEAVQALTEMVNWIGTISPSAVTTQIEVATRMLWQSGAAIFMRNWPYAYALAQAATDSKVANKFGVRSTLSGGSSKTGHSSTGGYQLGVNALIDADRKQAAWEFIKYMLAPEAQKIGATVATWAVTLQSVYEDPDVLTQMPLFQQLQPIVQTALPRPMTPKYPDVSAAIQFFVYQALTKKETPRNALAGLATRLSALV